MRLKAATREITYRDGAGRVKGRATVVGVADVPERRGKRPHRFDLELERHADFPGLTWMAVRAYDAETKARWLDALLPQIAARHGVSAARIEGLGSLVGVSFTEGRIADYATELLLTGGALDQGRATLEAVATGFDGHPHAGRLAEGRNRICITAELLILPQV